MMPSASSDRYNDCLADVVQDRKAASHRSLRIKRNCEARLIPYDVARTLPGKCFVMNPTSYGVFSSNVPIMVRQTAQILPESQLRALGEAL